MGDWNLNCPSSAGQNQGPQVAASRPEDGTSQSTEPSADHRDEHDPRGPLPYPVVGIGLQARCAEACFDLFSNLPPDTGMAFVVIAPFADGQQKYLAEVLSSCSQMPVEEATSGTCLQPNRVFVAPAGAGARLKRGKIKMDAATAEGSNAIDDFLESLAVAQKTRAIGVVLSGTHTGGGPGLRAIRNGGGIAIVESPRSSDGRDTGTSGVLFDEVDRILPADQIAFALTQIGRQFQQSPPGVIEQGLLEPGGELPYSCLLDLLRAVSEVDFRAYKPGMIRRRIARRMLLLAIPSLTEYVAFLQTNPAELRALHEDALVRATSFFRDPAVFQALTDSIFPRLFAHWSPGQPIRIWAPGCSSGEEAYSIAICLLEYLAARSIDAPVHLFGTDASQQAIEKARCGIFPESVAAEVSPERLFHFFVKVGGGYQIARRVRDLCIFARQNLCLDPPLSRMDLISCRNVLTAFEQEPKQQILSTLHYALKPDGFLLLGQAETAQQSADLFQLIDHRHKFFAKVGNGSTTAKWNFVPHSLPSASVRMAPTSSEKSWRDIRRAADRLVLARYGPPGVLVDEKMNILHSRGQTSPFMDMPEGRVTLNVERMLRDGLSAPVSLALQRAIEEDLPVRMDNLRVALDDGVREINVEVLPIHTAAEHPRRFLVLFAPPHGVQPDGSACNQNLVPSQNDLVERLRQDLLSTRTYLQSLFAERDVRNRELALASQEVQSANKATDYANQELTSIQDDLARADDVWKTVGDLQQRNATLSQTIDELSNLLNSLNLPAILLGNELQIKQFTPPAQRLMHLRPTDIGRPVADVGLNLPVSDFVPLFQKVLETLTPAEMEVQDREGRWYVLRAGPHRTADNRIDGVVAVLVDIDKFRRSEQELAESRDFEMSLIENLPSAVVAVDFGLRIRLANEAFRSLVGIASDDLEGRSFLDLASALWGLDEPLRTHLENLRSSGDAGGRFMFEHRTGGEKAKVLDIRGCALKTGKEIHLMVTLRDVTAHKDVERFLALEGERLANEVAATTRELSRTQQELRALAASLFQSQEEERRRVARELHDGISQKLALLEIGAQQVEPRIAGDPGGARTELQRVRIAIGELSEEVRRISHGLHPSVIEDLGVNPAVRSLVEDFRDRERMIVTFRAQNVPEGIPLEIATGLYRITQEALRNIAKHAGKTHVKVLLDGEPTRIRLQVIDAGKGFDLEARRMGLGLISIGERARAMRGRLTIESELGKGTRIAVEVPLL